MSVPSPSQLRRRSGPSWRLIAAFAAILSVGLAACGGGSYRYVTISHPVLTYKVPVANRDDVALSVKAASTYLRLPVSWRVYSHIDELLHLGVASLPPDRQYDLVHKTQFRPFDGNASPSLDNVDSQAGSRPSGMEEILVLDDTQRDSFSLSTIRNFSIKYDQSLFEANSSGSAPPVRIISEDTSLVRGSYHGSEIIFSLSLPDGSTQTIDQVALVDASTRVLYVLSIGCEAHCFTDYAGTIRDVVRSWTLR